MVLDVQSQLRRRHLHDEGWKIGMDVSWEVTLHRSSATRKERVPRLNIIQKRAIILPLLPSHE
jgi:hypothetical protein